MHAVALVVALAVYGAGRQFDVPVLASVGVLSAAAVLAVYIIRSDEVERALAVQSSAWAFGAALLGAVLINVLGLLAFATEWLPQLWAILIGAWLIAWVVLRVRLG
jgi:hypothetical protein